MILKSILCKVMLHKYMLIKGMLLKVYCSTYPPQYYAAQIVGTEGRAVEGLTVL